MNQDSPQRFVLIGLPGSGKSTFAIKLGKILTIPVHHLDKHMFEVGGKKRNRQEILSIEQELMIEESWIIEGCSMSTLEMRFAKAHTVIYFHFSRLLCMARLFKRLFFYDKTITDTGCTRMINGRLLKYIWNFHKEKGKSIEALKEKYPHVDFRIFKSSLDAENYIKYFT